MMPEGQKREKASILSVSRPDIAVVRIREIVGTVPFVADIEIAVVGVRELVAADSSGARIDTPWRIGAAAKHRSPRTGHIRTFADER